MTAKANPNLVELLLRDGVFIKRIVSEHVVGSQDDVLKKFYADIPVDIPFSFVLPGGLPAHLQVSGATISIWTELVKLSLATVWTLTEGGVRYPIFKDKAAATPPEHEASHILEPIKAQMRLFLISIAQYDKRTSSYVWANSYMVARAPGRKECFRPPLPNVFDDGKMCMGGDYKTAHPCLADLFVHNLQHIERSRWNSHLTEGLDQKTVSALFSIKDNTHQPCPPEIKFWEHHRCPPISNSAFSSIQFPTF